MLINALICKILNSQAVSTTHTPNAPAFDSIKDTLTPHLHGFWCSVSQGFASTRPTTRGMANMHIPPWVFQELAILRCPQGHWSMDRI